jgi:energy-coupling factor transporter ATP-binding protein EcfA2
MSAHPPKLDQAQALLYHARAATPFSSEDGESYASVPTGIDSRRVLPLRSAAFRDWLTNNFLSEYDTAPSAQAFRDALYTLEARARHGEVPSQRVDYRLGFEGDPFLPSKIFLDLANESGELVEITSKGWQTTDNLQHNFRQDSTTLPIPHPIVDRQPLAAFASLFRLTAESRARAFAWLAAALRPTGPYPILVLTGASGSGKSVLARAIRSLVDPSTVPIRRLPTSDRELRRLTFNNWAFVFDRVHRILSKVAGPMILIGPNNQSGTLDGRTLTIDLPHIHAPRSEAALWPEFEALRPALTAALCDAVATALSRIRDIEPVHVSRLPDCATWVTAAAPALGLDSAAIAEAFKNPNSTTRSHTSR